ncbi:NUDIX domain-containing protein [Vallitalea okinawensis]|uniref:NUDIX domain-containing protein n=1 Tax=Vallitalea okinawensis TaxID=2078660 RepID=UPI000CFE1186|nr:tautomerase family protein [Vallitalea okinawensis]
MPHINLKLWPGRSEEMKQEVAQRFTDVLVDTLNVDESSISIAIEEVSLGNWTELVYEEEIRPFKDRLYKQPGYEPQKEVEGSKKNFLEKVTAFIVRDERELLLIRHPKAGIQIPAGTVERGENHHKAVFREATEETGLHSLNLRKYIGFEEKVLKDPFRRILYNTKVFAASNDKSLTCASLRRGLMVEVINVQDHFAQITYKEFEKGNSKRLSYNITGWVPINKTTPFEKRHFYHLQYQGKGKERWEVKADNHIFELFWAPLNNLPPIVYPQNLWVHHLR